MRIPSVFIGIRVTDLATSQRWYEQFFGRAADVLVSADEVMWQLNETSWLFIVQDESARPSANVVLATDDLDEALDALARHGVEPLDLEVIDGAGRKAYLRDPDDNEVVLAEIYALQSLVTDYRGSEENEPSTLHIARQIAGVMNTLRSPWT